MKGPTETIGTKLRTWGNSDTYTSAQTFFTGTPFETLSEKSKTEFEAVVELLGRLAETLDGNKMPVVQFIALRRTSRLHYVAYRFTSDWAHSYYNRELLLRGPDLGRGAYAEWDGSSDDAE